MDVDAIAAGDPARRRTVVVTGGSTGIGSAAARALHRAGLKVVVTGRDEIRTKEVADELGTLPVLVDYTDLADVRRAAAQILDECGPIDVLANNAGGTWSDHRTTIDGYEYNWQVNYLAPALLTTLLLPRLRASAHPDRPGRVIATSSGIARMAKLPIDDGLDAVGRPTSFRGTAQYGTSKLADIHFTRELDRRERHHHLFAMSFQPGMVASDLGRNDPFMGRLLASPVGRLMRTPEQGAATLVWLATADASEVRPGAHYANRKVKKSSDRMCAPEVSARLWELTDQLLAPPA